MIDAKKAEENIEVAVNDNIFSTETAIRIIIGHALRGIMGELYRLRKLKEYEATEAKTEFLGSVNFDELYAEGEDE